MNKVLARKITASVVIGAALLGSGLTAHAVANEGYAIDTQGQLVRDGFGDCIKLGHWTAAMAIAECDSSLVKKPVPVPAPVVVAPAPTPAPAPVVEAPVVVAPVVVAPPPPPPAPIFKTEVIEKPFTLEGTAFDSGSSVLKKSAGTQLAEVVDFAAANAGSNLVVTGYTDSQGNEAKNVKLSAARAAAVKAYLVKKGVAADRISTKGVGSANPVGDNKTKDGRAANRRVEVTSTVREEKKVRVN